MTYGTSVSRKSTRRVVRLGPVRTLDSPRAGGRLSEVAARRTSCCTGGKRGTALVSWGRRLPSLRIVSRPNRANDLRDFHVPEVNSPRRAARPGSAARLSEKPEPSFRSRGAPYLLLHWGKTRYGACLLGKTASVSKVRLTAEPRKKQLNRREKREHKEYRSRY